MMIQTLWSFLVTRSNAMLVGQLVHQLGPGLNVLTTFCWIAIKFCIVIHGPQRKKNIDFGDPLTFYRTPPASHIFT